MREGGLPPDLMPYRMVGVREMADVLGYSVQHLRRLYRTGRIPRPHAIGGRKLGWSLSVLASLTSTLQQGDER